MSNPSFVGLSLLYSVRSPQICHISVAPGHRNWTTSTSLSHARLPPALARRLTRLRPSVLPRTTLSLSQGRSGRRRFDRLDEMLRATTVLAVRQGGQTVMASDGQVTFGDTVVK